MADKLPRELAAISPRIVVTGVANIVLDDVSVSADGIRLRGVGAVEIGLTAGSDSQVNENELHDDYPFAFDLVLNHRLELQEVTELRVDTSSFY
jgi:hypothetical protein